MSRALTPRLARAFEMALRLHQNQARKGSGTPYIAHLMAAAGLVLEDGGDEDQAAAALLHDAVEDQGGMETAAEIRAVFGDRVADIVLECSDASGPDKPPWRRRKAAFLARLPSASPDALRVVLADKLHNARSILLDYRTMGEAVWERFKPDREQTLGYYQSLVEILSEALPHSVLVGELARCVEELTRLAGASEGERE